MDTEDHAEWLAGIVITDVRSMKEDTDKNNKYNEMTTRSEITDSEGEEVDVEYMGEESPEEAQCEALRKLINLSTVELQNQALFWREEKHLQEFLKFTLEGTESESSDSDSENNDEHGEKDVEKKSYNSTSKLCFQSNTGLTTYAVDQISKLRTVKDQEQEEKHLVEEIFDDSEFVNIVPNFPGFAPMCQLPKHKLWRVKHLNTNKYIDGANNDNILCNENEISDIKNVILNASKKHCLARKLDEKPAKNDDKYPAFTNRTCRMPEQLVRNSSEKFHDGIMTRKRTTQLKEIFTIPEDDQIKYVTFDAVNLRNSPVKKDLRQLKNNHQIFSQNTYKYKRHSLDLGMSNKVTKGSEFSSATCNMNENYTMPGNHLNYNDKRKHKTKFYRKRQNFSKNNGNNSESVFVKLPRNETDAKTVKAYCNKEVQKENEDLNLQSFQKRSHDEIKTFARSPQSFNKVSMEICLDLNSDNKKQRVGRNGLIRYKGYKRKLSFGSSDPSACDELDHEKESLNGDIFFNSHNVNLELESKGNNMHPFVSLKRCDDNVNQIVFNVNQNKLTPHLNNASDLQLNADVSFQTVKDADKNVREFVIDDASNLNDECDYEVCKSLLTNSTEIDNSNYQILSSCALEPSILSIPMRPAVDVFCYQNNDLVKGNNINEQVFSRDFYELSIAKSLIIRKSLQVSNNSALSLNCGSKLAVKPSDSPRIRHSIFNHFCENKENLHGSALNLQCSICLENIHKKSVLKHMSLHIKDDNFVCNKCSSIFTDLYGLKKHYPICCKQKHCLPTSEQTGSVPLQCSICDHFFMKKTDYNKHFEFHLGHVNYMCNICGFAFNSEILLKSHEKRHFEDADNPYKCNVCFIDCDSMQGKIQHEKLLSERFKSFYCVK